MKCLLLGRSLQAGIALVLLSLLVLAPLEAADAAKKKKGGNADQAKIEAEVKAAVTPIEKILTTLSVKLQSRGLFSPQDAGQLADTKMKIFDLMSQYPTQPMIVRPVYQAGMILSDRGEYEDSYELLSFLSTQHGQTPYGIKAKAKMQQLERQLGPNFFPPPPVVEPTPGAETGKGAAPAKAASK